MVTTDSAPFRYGLIGTSQISFLDQTIASLGSAALVAYVGPGGNLHGAINNLAAEIGRNGFRGRRLVVLEYRSVWCVEARRAFDGRPYPRINIPVDFLTADITCAGAKSGTFDLIVALGVLGDLMDPVERMSPEPDRRRSWQRALNETARLLESTGIAMFGNSAVRQPLAEVTLLAKKAGLAVVQTVS